MELKVSHNLDLLMQSSAFAEDWRVKLMPNGMGFFIFLTFPKNLRHHRRCKNELPKMSI